MKFQSKIKKCKNRIAGKKKKKDEKRILKLKYIQNEHSSITKKSEKEEIKNKKNENENEIHFPIINSIEDWENYYKIQNEKFFKRNAEKIMKGLILKDKINESKKEVFKKHLIDINYRKSLIGYLFHMTEMNQIDCETYFLTIEIFDTYLLKTEEKINQIESEKLLLTSLYIASKMESTNLIGINLISCYEINGNKFTENEIEEKEKEIYKTIGCVFYDYQIHDYLGLLISDFEMNYKLYFNQTEKFEKTKLNCIYFLKLISLDYYIFYSYKKFFIIVVTMIYSFDFIRNQNKDYDEVFPIFHRWAVSILNYLNFNLEDTKKLYSEISNFFENLGQNHIDYFGYQFLL